MGSGKPRLSRTARALEDSIGHWRRLSEGAEGEPGPFGYNCALCQLDPGCDGCPVKARTGYGGCVDTPYWSASEAYDFYGPQSDEFKTAAKRELEFLESLR